METLKFSNGDIDVSVATGRPRYIRGLEKTSQDVAHTLLLRYDPRRQRGSELLDFEDRVHNSELVPAAQAGFVRRFVEEALNRLMAFQQRNRDKIPDDEFIEKVERVDIYSGDQPTDVYFYAMVLTKDGEITQAAFRINLRHQLPDSAAAFLPGSADDYGPRP